MPEYEKFMEILQNAGIDTAIGMECCADMEDIYADVVQTYFDEDNTADLQGALDSGDAMLYGTYAHGVKSASKSIGAMDFADFAYDLEMAGKAGDMDKIKAEHERFIAEYAKVQAILREALDAIEA